MRLDIDDKQVQLAAAHCEADSQGSELSLLLSKREQLQCEQDETDTTRFQVQEQIRAVLLYCGQAPSHVASEGTQPTASALANASNAQDALRQSSQQVTREMQNQLQVAAGLASSPVTLSSGKSGDDIDSAIDMSPPAENSLADIRARIEAYAQTKLGVEQQIEEQLRATHGVHQQYAMEKSELERAHTEVQTVSAQYGVLLQELQNQAEVYSQQRHEAEGVLRECSFALDMAVDTMTQKVAHIYEDDVELSDLVCDWCLASVACGLLSVHLSVFLLI